MQLKDNGQSAEALSKIGKQVPDETLDPDSKLPIHEENSFLKERSSDITASLWQLLKREMQR